MFLNEPNNVNLASFGSNYINVLASNDNVTKLLDLLKDKNFSIEEISKQDYKGNTPMHYAAISSSYKIAKLLMTFLISDPLQNKYGLTPIHFAAQVGDLMMLNILKESKIMMSKTSNCGWHPIHFAIYFNHLECVKMLINEYPRCINLLITTIDHSLSVYPIPEFNYKSPLDLAILKNHKEIIELLNSYNALPSLHAAVATHNLQAINYYVSTKEFKDKYLNTQYGKYQVTPLHLAAALGDAQVCYSLLFSGASTLIKDSQEFSPIEAAIVSQSADTVNVLLLTSDKESRAKALFLAAFLHNEKICIDIISKCNDLKNEIEEETGDSILMKLIKYNSFKAAELLIQQKCDLTHTNKKGMNCLHIAASKNAVVIISTIIVSQEGQSLLNSQDINGRTPIFYALLNYSYDAIKILNKFNCSMDKKDNFGFHPFSIAAGLGIPVRTKQQMVLSLTHTIDLLGFYNSLIEKDPDVKITPYGIQDNLENTTNQPFSIVCDNTLSILKRSIDTSPVINDSTLIHIVIIMNTDIKIIQQIVCSARHLLDTPDGSGLYPFHLAAKLKMPEVVDLFLKANIDIKAQDPKGNNILHYLTDNSMSEQLTFIYDTYQNVPYNIQNKDGDLPIHIAIRNNAYEIVKIHVNNCKDDSIFQIKNKMGQTSYQCAIKAEATQALNALFSNRNNPLIGAVIRSDKKKVLEYLDAGISVESTDSKMMTPLHHAAKNGDLEMVQLLLQRGADIEAISKYPYTPLHYAAISGNKDVCVELLSIPIHMVNSDFTDQAYYFAQNMDIKELLFKFWKREQLCLKLNSILKIFNGTFKNYLKYINEIRENDKIKVIEEFANIIERLLLVFERYDKFVNSIGVFRKSLHNFFIQFLSLNCEPFFVYIKSNVADLMNFKTSKPDQENTRRKVLMSIYHYLHLINLINKYIHYIARYTINEFDQHELLSKITSLVTSQTSKSKDALVQLRGSIFLLFDMPPDIPGQPIFVSDAQISNISYSPLLRFNDDLNESYRKLFHTTVSMPRTIPFKNQQTIRIFIINTIVFFKNNSKTLALPRQFIYARPLYKNSTTLVSTPLGSFTLKFSSVNTFGPDFVKILNVRSLKGPIVIDGLSALYDNKENTYQCIAAYQVPTRKFVTLRLMTIRTAAEESCYDVAMNYIKENDTPNILFLTVSAKKINDEFITL